MRTAYTVFLLLFLELPTFYGYEEKEFQCLPMSLSLPSTFICNGILDCPWPADDGSSEDLADESTEICAPAPFLLEDIGLQISDVTSTSVQLTWSKDITRISDHSLKVAGYFVTGKSEPHSFQNSISGRLQSYLAQWLKPWTDYTFIVRPYYTDRGVPRTSYKLGRAASVSVRTLPSEPEAPELVSLLSAQQRNIVLNIVGPSSWNSVPIGFHVHWEAIGDSRGPQGELEVPLPADWSPSGSALNITLPLQGGYDYRVSVRARGGPIIGDESLGPAYDVDVNVPLDSYEVSANVLDHSTVAISWRASEPVDIFKLSVYIDSGEDVYDIFAIRKFEGSQKASSRRTVLLTDLQPWRYYMASLEGCSAEICSAAVNTTFKTPARDIPAVVVTHIGSTSTSSFDLAWTFPQNDSRLYDGFSVEYCPEKLAACFVVYTEEKKLTVEGLDPASKVGVEVRAQFKGTDGRMLLGPAARASITTWKDVPDLQVTQEAYTEDSFGTFFLRWRCFNGSLEYFQYWTQGEKNWTNCSDSSDCDVTVNDGRTAAFSSGYIRLTPQVPPHDLKIRVRGCNLHGCGQVQSFSGNSRAKDHPSLSGATVTRREHGATIKWTSPNFIHGGVEATWHCNEKRTLHRRREPHGDYYYSSNGSRGTIGVPANATQCKFVVRAYKEMRGILYYGPPIEPTLE